MFISKIKFLYVTFMSGAYDFLKEGKEKAGNEVNPIINEIVVPVLAGILFVTGALSLKRKKQSTQNALYKPCKTKPYNEKKSRKKMFFFLVFLFGFCVGVLTSVVAMFKIVQKDLKNELDDDHIIHGTYDCFDER